MPICKKGSRRKNGILNHSLLDYFEPESLQGSPESQKNSKNGEIKVKIERTKRSKKDISSALNGHVVQNGDADCLPNEAHSNNTKNSHGISAEKYQGYSDSHLKHGEKSEYGAEGHLNSDTTPTPPTLSTPHSSPPSFKLHSLPNPPMPHTSPHSLTSPNPSPYPNTINKPSNHDNTINKPSNHDNTINKPSNHDNTINKPSNHDNTINRPSNHDNTINKPSNHDNTIKTSPSFPIQPNKLPLKLLNGFVKSVNTKPQKKKKTTKKIVTKNKKYNNKNIKNANTSSFLHVNSTPYLSPSTTTATNQVATTTTTTTTVATTTASTTDAAKTIAPTTSTTTTTADITTTTTAAPSKPTTPSKLTTTATNATTATPPGGVQKRMEDFFRVRRSARTYTSFQIKKLQEEQVEDMILKASREDNEQHIKVVDVEGKGRGVVATRPFRKGEFVVEYAGDLLSVSEARRREESYSRDERLGCYMYFFKHANKHYCVDATAESGRLGRLLNHSRVHPNCCTKVFEVRGVPRLSLVTRRAVVAGEELLYDYGDRSKEALLNHPWLSL